jgi:hypothetical protein
MLTSANTDKVLAALSAASPAAVNSVLVPSASSKWNVRVKLKPTMTIRVMVQRYIQEYAPEDADTAAFQAFADKCLEGSD